MQPNNHTNNGVVSSQGKRDPYLADLLNPAPGESAVRSETMQSVMDELSGTATSRRAQLYNLLHRDA
jgi:hypothetical protein